MGTAAGKMGPPGEADLGNPIPGTGSGALAETPAAAESSVSVGVREALSLPKPAPSSWDAAAGPFTWELPLASHPTLGQGSPRCPFCWLGQRFVL